MRVFFWNKAGMYSPSSFCQVSTQVALNSSALSLFGEGSKIIWVGWMWIYETEHTGHSRACCYCTEPGTVHSTLWFHISLDLAAQHQSSLASLHVEWCFFRNETNVRFIFFKWLELYTNERYSNHVTRAELEMTVEAFMKFIKCILFSSSDGKRHSAF